VADGILRLAATHRRRNVPGLTDRPLRIAYLFTTFPKSTETFLQREVTALLAAGVDLRLYSLLGGGDEFEGVPVRRFRLGRLIELIWIIPWVAATRWDVFGVIWRGLWTRRAPSWINFWENMLGAGFAGIFRRELRQLEPDLIHAVWGTAPATAAWLLHRLDGHRYTAAAHAYDIYKRGGDWWLNEKLAEAQMVHTSTEMSRTALIERGVPPERIVLSRRGLPRFPVCRPLRSDRTELRILCIARLVAKKGFAHQVRIYAALRDAGVRYTARIVGEGPERAALQAQLTEHGLTDRVILTGHLPSTEVWAQLTWADILIHTGVVAPSGDRDGLPNVIPEAMAAGVLVVTSPAAATTEAVQEGVSGRVVSVDAPERWAEVLLELQTNAGLAETLRVNARDWVEREYDSNRNVARLQAAFREALK